MSVRDDIESLVTDLGRLSEGAQRAEAAAQRALDAFENEDYAEARNALDYTLTELQVEGTADLQTRASMAAGEIEEETRV